MVNCQRTRFQAIQSARKLVSYHGPMVVFWWSWRIGWTFASAQSVPVHQLSDYTLVMEGGAFDMSEGCMVERMYLFPSRTYFDSMMATNP